MEKKSVPFEIADLTWSACLIGAALSLEAIIEREWAGYSVMENPTLVVLSVAIGALFFAGVCAPIKHKAYGAVAGAVIMLAVYLCLMSGWVRYALLKQHPSPLERIGQS